MSQGDHPPLGRIERKSLLYRSGLGFYCINHVQGCAHGCRYPCHAFLIFNRHGRIRDYAEWCRPQLVTNALSLLDRELARKRTRPECVHLCLSTDPFMLGYSEVGELSLALIERLNQAGIFCSVLTKGLLPEALADRTRFLAANTFGISLVSLDEEFRRKWEPGTAPYSERIAGLRRLHELGCRTRIHMEPYPTPNIVRQDLRAILERVGFADQIFFGKWNYNRHLADFAGASSFYAKETAAVWDFCANHGIECETP